MKSDDSKKTKSPRLERLLVYMTPEEKKRLAAMADAEKKSMNELIRRRVFG